jgi:sigma-B regulation protein RsbU (phosphoserine phosphatase)
MTNTQDFTSASERVSRVIFDYAARIGQEQDTDTLLRLNADMARDLVGADRCSIWLIDESAGGELYTRVAHGVGEIRVEAGHGLVGTCVRGAVAVVVNDTSTDERFLNRIDQDSGYVTNSVLVIPLCVAGGKVIGAFQALNKPGGFSDTDVSLLGLAASYSAAAIETQRLRREAEAARVLRHELEIAREVQAGLLPQQMASRKGIECAAFFRPAKFVGGDYYDVIEMAGGEFAFTLGDVSGKGVPAAVLMASIQSSLRIPLRRESYSLPGLMSELNESVYASSAAGRYSTLFCGIIDPVFRHLTYVNAGQCPPMLLRRCNGSPRIERLTTGGTPIGLLADACYQEASVTLREGDLLVCFSDGVSESTNVAGEMWHESEVEAVLRAAFDSSARQITDCLVHAADEFAAGAEQADDMTILTVRVT